MHRAGDPGHRLTDGERLELRRQIAGGATHAAAAAAVHCATKTVQLLLVRTGGLAPRDRPCAPLRLSPGEREKISRGLQAGDSCRSIAGRIGRSPSTVSREVVRSGGRVRYRAWQADKLALRRARRPKTFKLARCARLREVVERLLERRWSPQQITHRLVRDYPGDKEMRVSHETIYRSPFLQARGALRHELARCLRTGRAQRRSRRRLPWTG